MRRRSVGTFAGNGGGRRNPVGGPIQGGGGGDGGGGAIISRGTIPPGFITDDALNGAQLSTKHIRFHRQGFAYDETFYDVGAHDNTGWSRTGGVADSLMLHLGTSEDAFVAYIWGCVTWANNTATDYTGQMCLCLYQGTDTDDDGIVDTWTDYQRSLNVIRNHLPGDSVGHLFSLFSQFVVPADSTGIDWWVGMQHQVTAATNPIAGTQRQRMQTLMGYTCAFDPDLDSNLLTDSGLE